MANVEVSLVVPVVTCQKPGCTEDPTDMVPTSASINGSGNMVCTSSRLPEGWIRMVEVQADGSEAPFKVYCPACAAAL